MPSVYKIPLVLTPQPEGGYTVTSPLLPEFLTEGETPEEVMQNVPDALEAALEIYEDLKRPLPGDLQQEPASHPIEFDCLIAAR